MSRYFDAEKVTGTLASMRHKCDTNDIDDFYNMLSCAFDVLPPADVVEVVRCGECKQCERYIKAHYKNEIEVESHECRKYKMAVTPDWFCADGKRREDGEIR